MKAPILSVIALLLLHTPILAQEEQEAAEGFIKDNGIFCKTTLDLEFYITRKTLPAECTWLDKGDVYHIKILEKLEKTAFIGEVEYQLVKFKILQFHKDAGKVIFHSDDDGNIRYTYFRKESAI